METTPTLVAIAAIAPVERRVGSDIAEVDVEDKEDNWETEAVVDTPDTEILVGTEVDVGPVGSEMN